MFGNSEIIYDGAGSFSPEAESARCLPTKLNPILGEGAEGEGELARGPMQ